MNKYHLLWILERWPPRPDRRYFEYAAISIALLVGVMFALLTANFRRYAGIDAEVWEALAILLIVVSGFVTAVFTILGAIDKIKALGEIKKTPEDLVNEIIDQMAENNQRASSR